MGLDRITFCEAPGLLFVQYDPACQHGAPAADLSPQAAVPPELHSATSVLDCKPVVHGCQSSLPGLMTWPTAS